MDRFYELSEDTIDDFYNVFNKKSFPISVKFQFIGDSKQKNLIKISKLADDISFLLQKELKISINEDLMNVFDEESITILFEQEIDKININLDSGKIKLVKTDLNTFSSIVNKYGVEKVARANKVEELYDEQQKDVKNDEEFII
jgi:soluble cytochrome b562